jgi:hypothetical protein
MNVWSSEKEGGVVGMRRRLRRKSERQRPCRSALAMVCRSHDLSGTVRVSYGTRSELTVLSVRRYWFEEYCSFLRTDE